MHAGLAVVAAVVLVFALGGCAYFVKQQLASLTRADVETAMVLAQDDPDATACYTAIMETLPKEGVSLVPDAAGPLSAFQKVRNLRRGIAADIPPMVHRLCAVLVLDAQRTVRRLGLRILRLR